MPKLDHPFHGKRASGRFGDMLVYGSWKGISYVRIYRKPKMKESARLRKVNDLGAVLPVPDSFRETRFRISRPGGGLSVF